MVTSKEAKQCLASVSASAARYISNQNPNLGKFGKVLQRKMLGPFCLFCSQFVFFITSWFILWSFGTIFPFLVCCTEKNLATLACA
jgi:hypothetical protein